MRDVHVSGNYAYCSMRLGLMIVDVSNPQHPEFVSRILMPTMPGGVQVVDGYAFITGGGIVGERGVVMTVVDVTDPVNPEVVATFLDEPIPLADLAIVGGRAYITARTQGLIVANVDDPTAPYLMGQFDWSDASDVEVVGDTAWVVFGGYSIKAIDISDPYDPHPVGSSASVTCHTDCIQVIGDYIYVADLDSGLTIMKIDGSPPSIVGRVPEAGRSYEVQVVGDFAYLSAAFPRAVAVVDVSDPEDPVFIGHFGDYNKSSRGIHVVGDLAFLARESTGLLLVDIDNPYNLQETGWFWESHHVCTMIEVADGYCYASQVDSILIMSLADPIRPATVGVAREGNLRDFEVVGNRLYVSNVNSFSIWDVTDKTAPIELSDYWTNYQEMRDMRIRDGFVYAAMDTAGIWVFDVTDPTTPVVVATFEPVNCDYKIETVELYQEFAIFGYYCYEDYSCGLMVLDISNPVQP